MDKLKKLLDIFLVFFKIGTFTFGGGYAMLPLIQKEFVDDRKWVSEEEMLDIFAISQSLPGVIAINSSLFVGKKVLGVSGAVAAAAGVILPAFLSILLILLLLTSFKGNVYVSKAFAGIRSASAALILLAAIKLGKSAIKGKSGYIISILSFLAIVIFDIHAAWVVVFGGIIGLLTYLYNRRRSNA